MSSPLASTTHCSFREIYLETASESFDLHNCFDFVGFTYEPSARTALLRWTANEYASQEQRRSLLVEFTGVAHLSATPRDTEMPFSEDTCLASVGGVEASDPTLEVYQRCLWLALRLHVHVWLCASHWRGVRPFATP